MLRRSLLWGSAVLLLTACGGTGTTGPVIDDGGAATSPEGAWELTVAQPTIDLPDATRVTLEVAADGDAWQVGGSAACNSYGGTVTTDGSAWRTQGYSATEMGCLEPLMSIERAYLDALSAVETFSRNSPDELVLAGPDVELRFAALPPVPTAELTSTTWVLDGLVGGSGPDAGVSSTVAGADEATLRLEPDGTLEATTGCRSFTGSWTESGDEILLPMFGERDDSPNVAADGTVSCDAAVLAQDDQVLAVLGDGFRVAVDGQRLTLTSSDGRGLSYVAADD